MSDWHSLMSEEERELGLRLVSEVSAMRAAGRAVFPPEGQEFRALELTPPKSVKAVILGQDPYPTAGHANGLAFSVNPDVRPLPRSLANIFREYTADLGYGAPSGGDLTPWAGHGVLLLNPVLTVEEGLPLSHRSLGWQRFTSAVLRACAALPQPVVFLLWGRQAMDAFSHACGSVPLRGKAILASSHPSPLGASRSGPGMPAFFGSRPFSGANRLLKAAGAEEIDWRLPV